MENLATSADLVRFGYPEEAAAMLARASARVRNYTRQAITAGTSTVQLDYPYRLPERPVRSVESVRNLYGGEVPFHRNGSRLLIGSYKSVTVTYDHGWETLPDDLIEVVCSIAARMHSAPDVLAAGVRSEHAGGEQVTWGSEAYAGTSELTAAEKSVLDRIYPSTRRIPSHTVLL